jgi:hypothetical protein
VRERERKREREGEKERERQRERDGHQILMRRGLVLTGTFTLRTDRTIVR